MGLLTLFPFVGVVCLWVFLFVFCCFWGLGLGG